MVMAVTPMRPTLPVGHPLMQPNAFAVRRVLKTLVLPPGVERVSFLVAEDFGLDGMKITLVVTMKSGVVLHQGMFLTDALLQNGTLRPVLETTVGDTISNRSRAYV